jgi:Flp pilus assembly protein TadG
MAPLARPSARIASWRTFFRGTDGNAAIIFALSLIVILVAAGGAVDYARAYNAHKALQASIDSSVLAGAGAGYSATAALAVFDAQHDILQHISFEGTIGVPVYGTAADGSFTGTVTAQVTTYFL